MMNISSVYTLDYDCSITLFPNISKTITGFLQSKNQLNCLWWFVYNNVFIHPENLNTCSNEGKVASDECKRVCQCTNGTMTNCYRLRTEWNLLSTEERLYFINAYKELRYNKRFHEKFVQLHLMHPTIDLSVAHSFDNDFIFHRM